MREKAQYHTLASRLWHPFTQVGDLASHSENGLQLRDSAGLSPASPLLSVPSGATDACVSYSFELSHSIRGARQLVNAQASHLLTALSIRSDRTRIGWARSLVLPSA